MPPIEMPPTRRAANGVLANVGGAAVAATTTTPKHASSPSVLIPPSPVAHRRPEESTKPPPPPGVVPTHLTSQSEHSPSSTYSRRTPVGRHWSNASFGSLDTFYSSRRGTPEEVPPVKALYDDDDDNFDDDTAEFDGHTSFQSATTASTVASGATRMRPLMGRNTTTSNSNHNNTSATWSIGTEEITMDRLPKRVPRRSSGSPDPTTTTTSVTTTTTTTNHHQNDYTTMTNEDDAVQVDHGGGGGGGSGTGNNTGPPIPPRRTIGGDHGPPMGSDSNNPISTDRAAVDESVSSTATAATADTAVNSTIMQPSSSTQSFDRMLDGDKYNDHLPRTNIPFAAIQPSDVGSASTSPSHIFQTLLTLKRQRKAVSVAGGSSIASSLSMASIPMSTQSHHSFSPPVQSLLDLAATVVNSTSLVEATSLYGSAMQASGAQIVRLNKAKLAAATLSQKSQQQQQAKRQSSTAAATSRDNKAAYHRELRAIGTIMGLLRTRMSLIHCVHDEFEKAVEYCDGAIQVHSHQPTLKDNIKGAKLNEVDELSGLMLLIIERLKKARHALARHFELLQRIDALSVTYTDGGDVSLSGGSVMSMFMDNLSPDATPREILFEVIEQSVRAEDESTVGLYDENMLEILSVHAVENDRQEEAIKFLRDAIQIHLVALGLKHKTLGKSLIRIAKMYRGTGNDRENEKLVLGYFHQTAAVLKRSILGNHERGSILNDIAVIHMRRFDFDEAIKFLLDALHAYDEDAEEIQKSGRTAASLQVWRNLGECYMHLKKYRSAEGAFLKSLDIQDTARRLQDTAESLDLAVIGVDKSLVKLISDSSIANTVCRIGRARAGGGDLRRALDLYKQALNVIHRGSSEDSLLSDQELLIKRDQLTEVFLLIADACGTLGEINKAFAAYRSALRLRTANGADTLDKRLQTRIHCLKCYGGISDLYVKLNEFDNAVKQLQEALEYASASNMNHDHVVVQSLRQKLAAAENTLAVTPDRISQITHLERQADAEIENGTLDKATKTLRELLGLRRAMLKNMKDRGLETTDQIYSIACLLQTFGFVFAKNGDDLNAEIAFKDASLLFKKTGRSSDPATSQTRLSL